MSPQHHQRHRLAAEAAGPSWVHSWACLVGHQLEVPWASKLAFLVGPCLELADLVEVAHPLPGKIAEALRHLAYHQREAFHPYRREVASEEAYLQGDHQGRQSH